MVISLQKHPDNFVKCDVMQSEVLCCVLPGGGCGVDTMVLVLTRIQTLGQ